MVGEELLQAVIDNAAVLVVVLDRNGRIVRFNKTCEHLTGFSESELLGEHVSTRLLPADEAVSVSRVFHDLVDTAHGGRRYTNHWRTKSGELLLIEWNNSTVHAHGHVRYVIAVGVDITASEQERIINAKKNAALEASLNAVAIAELDGSITYINPAFLKLWGYDHETEVLGRGALSFWKFPERVEPVFSKLITHGQWVGELEGVRKDGGTFIAKLSAVVVHADDGSPACLMSSFIDVTALHEAEAAADSNRRRFEAFFNASSDGILFADAATGTFISANPRWYSMLGYTPEELPGLGIHMLHPPEDIEEHFSNFSRMARGDLEVVRDASVLRKDGGIFYADISALPIEVGGKYYLAGVFRDVTARVVAERALRASEEKYRVLVDNQNELIVKFTPDLRLTFVNPVYCRTFSKREDELIGRTFVPLINEVDHARVLESLDRLRQPPHTCYHEERVTTVDGERWLAWSDRAITDDHGEIVEVVGVGRDITERKRLEAQLAEAQKLAHIGSWELDIPSGNLYWSDEIFRILEIDKAQFDVSYEAFLNIIHPDDRDFVNDTYRQSVADRTLYTIEHRLCMPDGRIKYVQELGETLYATDGSPLRSIGTVQDITERWEQGQKLRQWAAAFENTVEGVLITDAESNIIDVNQAFVHLTGYSREEVLGKKPSLRRSHLQTSEFFHQMWTTLKTTGSWQGEIWNRKKNGEVSPEWLTITTLYEANGKPSNYVGVFTDISAIKESEQRLSYMANHDPLTDLPNRSVLSDRVDQALLRGRRSGEKLAVLFLDLDHFKTINDTLGHPVGDRLLKEVAKRLRTLLRESDTVGRLGGDEFLILIEDFTSHQEVDVVADKIISAMTQRFEVDEHELYIGGSIGISVGPDDGQTASVLIQNADAAMYKSKDAGRNTFHYYSTEFTEAAKLRYDLVVELRHALERNEFELYYQPKIRLHDGSLTGAEVLLRWNNPQRGMVPPDVFIPLAEDNGLIVEIGSWVLQTACKSLADWKRRGLPIVQLAVNVSAIQIFRGNLLDVVNGVLSNCALDAAALEIEITESVLMHSPEKARQVLGALRERGVRLALDDFGTGYSSLSNLKNFPFSTIKIDRTFVEDIASDSQDESIIKAVIAMGRSLELEVVAEGVETSAQESFLLHHGCHQAQGYLYSKPVPMLAFEALLMQQAS